MWASGLNGFLYSVQTLIQMLPEIPCCTIEDEPRFAYRGLHLDVARHFFDVPVIKRYIDLMALHKMNTFHWHLTDDQGWRIEIKRYPELIARGSVRKQTLVGHNHTSDVYDGIPYGGYYTQEQIREVVDYASSKGITVIPEIDLPGHMLAALTAYPHLGCTEGPYELWCRWGVSDDVLCPGKSETFDFIEGVLDEVMDIFPSRYIHIGGDECPKVRWEKCPDCQALISDLGLVDDDAHSAEHYLQSYVISRVEKYLNGRGRMIIGWDEILEGGLAPHSTVMSWHGEAGGLEAARQGHDVIMTPNTYYYLDYHQGTDLDREPLGIGGYLPLKKCYSYEPTTEEMTEEAMSGIVENMMLSFDGMNMIWPVPEGNDILIPYSMDKAVYFETLDQYKYSPAMIIAAEEGTPVCAVSAGKITRRYWDYETGWTYEMDLGGGFKAYYGQLDYLQKAEDTYVAAGDVLGYVAAPTKYFAEEGSNLYFAMTQNGQPVCPENYMGE